MKNFGSRQFRLGAVSIAFSLLFITAVVLLNLITGYLTDKFMLKVDMTATGVYEISDQTRTMLAELKQDVTITVLSAREAYLVDQYTAAVPEMLDRYEALSGGRVSVRYIDPYINPTELEKYSGLGTPTGRNIIVSAGRDIMLDYSDLFVFETVEDPSGMESPYQTVTGLQAEQRLTSAIVFATGKGSARVVFTQGHGEMELPALEKLMRDANYAVEKFDLSRRGGEIPPDAAVVVIAGPTADFTSDELAELGEFQLGGGDIIYLYNFEGVSLVNLDKYLAGFGIEVTRELVLDDVNCFFDESDIAAELVANKITMGASATGLPVRAPLSQVLRNLTGTPEAEGAEVSAVLTASESAYTKRLDEGEVLESLAREPGDPSGPFDIALYGQIQDEEGHHAYGVLALPLYLAHDDMLSTTRLANSGLILGAMSVFNPEMSQGVIVQPRAYVSTAMPVIAGAGTIVFWMIVVALPLLMLALSLFVWIRRKRL